MSDQARDWVWNHSQSKGVARLVLLAMAERASGPECLVAAGSTWLMEQANSSRSAVLSALDRLAEAGEITLVEGIVSIYAHPVWILPKAIGYVPVQRESAALIPEDAVTSEHSQDPADWTPAPERERRIRSRIADCVRQATGSDTTAP